MIPIDFPEANRTFTRPADMTDEECAPLRVHDTGEALVSCWQLSPEELAEVQRTGVVWLWVFGRGMPPVAVQGASPFKSHKPTVVCSSCKQHPGDGTYCSACGALGREEFAP